MLFIHDIWINLSLSDPQIFLREQITDRDKFHTINECIYNFKQDSQHQVSLNLASGDNTRNVYFSIIKGDENPSVA